MRVGALRHPDGGAHDGVEVDEDAVAQQLVDLVLAHAVPGREPEQGGRLVGGVVVDVQVGPLPAPRRRASRRSRRGPAARRRGRGPRRCGTPVRRSRPRRCRRGTPAPRCASPRSDHSGSPSKSKKTSPALGVGIRRSVSRSVTSERTPPSGSRSCSSWSRACSRSRSSVAARTSGTGSVRTARSSIVVTPASSSLRRVGRRTPGDERAGRGRPRPRARRPRTGRRRATAGRPTPAGSVGGAVRERAGRRGGRGGRGRRARCRRGRSRARRRCRRRAGRGGGVDTGLAQQRGVGGDLQQRRARSRCGPAWCR